MKAKGNYFFVFTLWVTLVVFVATFIITLVANPLDDDGWSLRMLGAVTAALVVVVTPWALVALGWRIFTKEGRAQYRKEEEERQLKRWVRRCKWGGMNGKGYPFGSANE